MRLSLLFVLLAACSLGVFAPACPGDPGDGDAGSDAGGDAGVIDAGWQEDAGCQIPADDAGVVPWLKTLESQTDLDSLVDPQGVAKYLAEVDGAAPRAPIDEGCLFQNSTAWPFHIFFLHRFPETCGMGFGEYVNVVIRRASRVWWGGGVKWLPQTPHPLTGAPGTLIYFIYTEDTAGNRLVLDDVRAVDARLRGCVGFAAETLAFYPESPEQVATARAGQAELAADGIAVLLP